MTQAEDHGGYLVPPEITERLRPFLDALKAGMSLEDALKIDIEVPPDDPS